MGRHRSSQKPSPLPDPSGAGLKAFALGRRAHLHDVQAPQIQHPTAGVKPKPVAPSWVDEAWEAAATGAPAQHGPVRQQVHPLFARPAPPSWVDEAWEAAATGAPAQHGPVRQQVHPLFAAPPS
jgi:hypothetical protein